jgi:hypothetical protein
MLFFNILYFNNTVTQRNVRGELLDQGNFFFLSSDNLENNQRTIGIVVHECVLANEKAWDLHKNHRRLYTKSR